MTLDELKEHIACISKPIAPGVQIALMMDGSMGFLFVVPGTDAVHVLGGIEFMETAEAMSEFISHIGEDHMGMDMGEENEDSEPEEKDQRILH